MKFKKLYIISIIMPVVLFCACSGDNIGNEKIKQDKVANKYENAQKNEKKDKDERVVAQKSDDIFIGIKDNNGSFEISSNINNNSKLESVVSGVDEFSGVYSDNLHKLFFTTDNGEINSFSQNGLELCAKDSTGTYKEPAGYKWWTISSAYKMNKDKNMFAYVTKNKELYFVDEKSENKEVIKLSDDIGIEVVGYNEKPYISNERLFHISDNGKNISYLDNSKNLFNYNIQEKKSNLVAENVEFFEVSPNGNFLGYVQSGGDKVKVKNIENGDVTHSQHEIGWKTHVYDDGSIMTIDEIQEDTMSGRAYYMDAKGSFYEIPQSVVCYEIEQDSLFMQKQDEKLYFINDNYTLCDYDLNEKKSKEIMQDVFDFEIMGENIYYSSKDEVYKLNADGSEKIPHKSGRSISIKKINEENIIIAFSEGDLILNDKIIAKNVLNYSFNINTIGYTNTKGQVRTYNIETREDKLKFENVEEYDLIYFGDSIIHESQSFQTR